MRNILITVGGAVAVAMVAAGVYFGTAPTSLPPIAVVSPAAAADVKAILSVQPTDHVLGDASAPVTIVEYASLTCPHCAAFDVITLPELKKKWIDTGKVKLVYRDFPLDQNAAKAAQIAECAGKDRYFPVLELMFRGQPQWAAASDPIAELSKVVRIAGMSADDVKACLANDKIADAVVADFKSGETVGVNATPTLFINGELYRGPRTIEDLDGVIGKLLK